MLKVVQFCQNVGARINLALSPLALVPKTFSLQYQSPIIILWISEILDPFVFIRKHFCFFVLDHD